MKQKTTTLSETERKAISVLNFIATYDGLLGAAEIKYVLGCGIEKFIPKKKRHLVSISENSYPIKIRIKPVKKTTNK